jgi:hypothetical protein
MPPAGLADLPSRPARPGMTGIRDPMHAPLVEAVRPATLRPPTMTAAYRLRGRAEPRRTPGASVVCVPASRGWAVRASATPFDSVAGHPRAATLAAGSVAPASTPRSSPTGAAVRRARATVLPPVGLGRSIRRSPAAIGAGSAAAAALRRPRQLRARRLRARRPGRQCPVPRALPAHHRPWDRPGAGVRRSAGVASPMTARAVDRHPAAGAIDRIAAAPSRTIRATARSASRHRSFP